jgi:hypothetical protein
MGIAGGVISVGQDGDWGGKRHTGCFWGWYGLRYRVLRLLGLVQDLGWLGKVLAGWMIVELFPLPL